MIRVGLKKILFSFLLLSTIYNNYGIATFVHESVHSLQTEFNFTHIHLHKDGNIHSHLHSKHSDHTSTSESHDHEIQENQAITVLNTKWKSTQERFITLVILNLDLMLSHSNQENNNFITQTALSPPGHWIVQYNYAIPPLTAPPALA
jgi:hypothetical protein